MSYLGKAIRTKGAKEALGEGVLTLVNTWDLEKTKNAIVNRAKKNGTMKKVEVAAIMDIIEAIIAANKKGTI